MRRILTIALSALALCAPALAQTADERYSRTPTAVGDPGTVYCRLPQVLPGSRLGPVCRTNAEWARYPRYGMDANWGFGDPGIAMGEGSVAGQSSGGCSPVCM